MVKLATLTTHSITQPKAQDASSDDMKLSRHYIGTVIVKDQKILTDADGFREALRTILGKENVVYLGDITHTFSNDSFTSVIALSESHISVHTWPERSAVQLDVFLCNYINDNTTKC